MENITRDYLKKILETNNSVLHSTFDSIKNKTKNYHNKDYDSFLKWVEKQKNEYEVVRRHYNNFLKRKNLIHKEIFGDDLEASQRKNLEEILERDEILGIFFIDHIDEIEKILKKQEKEIKSPPKKGKIGWITEKYKSKTRQDLVGLLHKEEELFSEYLSLYWTKIQDLENRSKYYKEHELYDKIKDYVLKGSVAITAVPLGPIELLSIPLWGTYLSMESIEKLNKNFEDWRKIEKPRITRNLQ